MTRPRNKFSQLDLAADSTTETAARLTVFVAGLTTEIKADDNSHSQFRRRTDTRITAGTGFHNQARC